MAIIKDDEESRSKERPVGGGTSYLGGGYSGGGGGSSSSPSYSQSGGGGGAGGSFTNLSSYLYGGDAQGQELGAGLAGQVDTAGEQATKDINTFGTNALSEIAAGTPQAKIEDVTTYASTINPEPPPSAVAYTGPSEASMFGGYGNAQKSIQGVQEKVGEKGLGSFEGIQSMLKGGKGADYTEGMSMYDTMFAKKGGKDQIAGAQQKWSGIGDALKAKEGEVAQGIGFAKNQATNVNQAWQDAYSTAQNRTNAIQQVAAGQPGAGAGNYSSPAQVPAQVPTQVPAKTPATRGSDKLNTFDNLLMKSLPRSETAYTLPIPSGASSKELRESAVGTLAEKAQGGIDYYTGKGAKKINKWLGV